MEIVLYLRLPAEDWKKRQTENRRRVMDRILMDILNAGLAVDWLTDQAAATEADVSCGVSLFIVRAER